MNTNQSIEALAKQLFGNSYHTFYTLSPEFSQNPDTYMCWINECRNPATGLGVRNIRGSVLPFFGCKTCREQLNGAVSDDVPPMKSSLLAFDGTPIKKAA